MKISSLMINFSSYVINLHFLLPIAIFGFSLDFSNGKLNIVSAVTMLAIMLLISLVSVAVLVIHLKIKKKEIENDEVE